MNEDTSHWPDEWAESGMRSSAAFTADVLDGAEVPPRVWHAPGLIPGRTVTLLTGDGGVGKSTLALQLCCATVLGRPWIGQNPRAGNALYLSAEDDGAELHRRLADLATHFGSPFAGMGGLKLWPVADGDAVLGATSARSAIVEPTVLWRELTAMAEDWEPRLIVLDAAADVFAINENDRGQVRQAVAMLRRLAIQVDAAVVLLAHPSLTGLSSGSGFSGSTAWNNSVRSRLYLSRPKDDDGGQSAPDIRTLALKKANYGPSGAEFRLRLRGGAFESEDAGSGGVLDRAMADIRIERQFLDLLAAFQAQGRPVSESTGKSYAPNLFASDPRAQGTTSKGFAAAMARLFAAGEIEIREEGPPSRRRARIARRDQ